MDDAYEKAVDELGWNSSLEFEEHRLKLRTERLGRFIELNAGEVLINQEKELIARSEAVIEKLKNRRRD